MSRYVTNGPVKEGICLLPPTHYRMMPPQRTDAFHVQTQPYVPQQQPQQPGNQAQTLRGIAPTGPPNQASTPPTNDLKVQPVPQQQSMNHMQYVGPQQQVRGTQGPYYRSGPPSQATRMPNQHRGQQQIYPTQATQYMQMPMPAQMYITNAAMQYYSNGQRQQGFVQPAAPVIYQGQPIPSQFTFQPSPNQTPAAVPFSVPYFSMRPSHPTQNATVPPNANQPLPNLNMAQQQPPFQRQQNKRRAKAIPVIDPDTGVDRLDEVYDQQNNSHPPSGESSARQTPQPSVNTASKEIQMTFAKQVLQAANNDSSIDDQESHCGSLESDTVYHHSNSQAAAGPTSKLDHLVQSSNLKAQAKEFVLTSSNTAKETPIVSANCDAVEVTLPNKQMKDRESPAKGRKQKEQSREHKDSVKDVSIREKPSDKESSIVKTESNKTRESVVPSANVVASTVTVPAPIKDNKEVVNYREDKKNQKRDSKPETNVPIVESIESVPAPASQPAQPAQDVASSAKSKNSSQRTKDGPKQQITTNNQKPAVAPVPAPQPSKPSSKSSKKSEINQKGANKEGTDMDAFNDSVRLDAVNANINLTNEINANSVVNNPNTNANITANDAANKKNQNTEVPTFRTESKTLPKSKIDITDIVKDKPKPIKSFPPQPETQDETDRAPLSAGKLVQIKNEANVKATTENNTPAIIENKSELPYREGQWSPHNLDGKKVYDKDFLMALKGCPASRKKPDNLPDIVIANERGRLSDGRYSMSGRPDFTPSFTSYGGKSNSQRGAAPNRNSQSGKIGGSGGKNSKNHQVKVSISVREDVKLNEVENAWRPARFSKDDNANDEENRRTGELYKKVRGVLNKLTPQKFETLVSQVRELQIDTEERLQGVIDLVFEKAVDEPNFSVAYALMCRELALMQVPAANSTEDKKEVVQFRKLLVTRCQVEFEKQSSDESLRNLKVKEIAECTDPEKKKELQFDLDEHERRLRMKSVGNIRFIGELFKQQMLTTSIMMRCLHNLLENKDEESLECLCKLLTTIGKELEREGVNKKGVELSSIFNIMKDIVDKKHLKVSSRVRFMLQDVIDLRKNKWIPRRQDLNPKTIDQIQKEAENEQLNIQAMNSVPITPRKDDRGSNAGVNSDRKRRNVSDDGWQTTSSRNRTAFTVQSDKLKNKPPQTDEPLGSRQMFGNWSKGSNIKTDVAATTNTANMYAALEHIDTEKRPSGSRSNKDPYSSKGPSLERNSYKQSYDGRGSRSGSQHRSSERENSTLPVQKVPTLPPTQKPLPVVVSQIPVETTVSSMTEEQLERHVKNNLDEYLNESCTIEEYSQDTQATVPASYLSRVVADGYLHVLERSSTARKRTGTLFAKLLKMGTLPLNDYCIGLEEILSQVDELTIDIPMIWNYLAEILVPLIVEEALPLSRLHKSCEVILQQGHGAKFLGALFKLAVSDNVANFLVSSWQTSGLSFEDFMKPSQVDSFLRENNLGFLHGGEAPGAGKSQLTYDQIYKKLSEFFQLKTSFDDIVNWITANVGDLVKENKFVRILVTTIFENSIARQKPVVENLKDHYKLLQKYVDNNPNYELQCLYALQALIHKMEHPKGLLLTICNQLYEDAIISQDSFIAWEASDDSAEQEGKGVALKQLTSFFTQLKENEESGSSSDET